MKNIYSLLLSFCLILSASAQTDSTVTNLKIARANSDNLKSSDKYADEMYKIDYKWEVPLTLALDGFSLYGMSRIYSRDKASVQDIEALDYHDINSFDRPVWDNYDTKAKDLSDKFFYGSMPLPLFLMLDKDIRKDWYKVGLLYLQAMGATGTIYTGGAMLANRYRPYAYNPAVDMSYRTRGGVHNSFPAGHPALVATSTFFCAKVFSDYNPDFKQKWILYTAAAGATLATGYLRVKAGQHFKTDVITGITFGTASGLLIPHLHKIRKGKLARLNLYPNYENNQTGFSAFYKLNKD